MARAIVLLVICVTTIGCASREKKATQILEVTEGALSHLAAYREIKCQAQVTFAQPNKTAWLNKLSAEQKMTAGTAAQTFTAIEELSFAWRATPYRCQLHAPRMEQQSAASKEVLADTVRKMETSMCLWLQSFYSDSPLRGWRKGEGVIEPTNNGVILKKSQGRGLEVSRDGFRVSALLGPDSYLRAEYQMVGNQLYPVIVEFKKSADLNRMDQFTYTNVLGRELPQSFWLNLANADGVPVAYMKIETTNCDWQ
jgi:hypothetical protein